MLPASVSEQLKEGTAAEAVLQEWPEVTILFCYITGFKELTTSCDPYDVVDFVNSLFSSFDQVCLRYAALVQHRGRGDSFSTASSRKKFRSHKG